MAKKLFLIQAKSIIPGDWGDYGDILQHGMTEYSGRQHDLLSLERTGPYIPPITFPAGGDVLVTSKLRSQLRESGLTGFTFLHVKKELIVELHWEKWNLSAKEPKEYPPSGEPEDYILGHPNSVTASAAMGEIWELVVARNAVFVPGKEDRLGLPLEYPVLASSWNGDDIIKGKNVLYTFVSERAKAWFTEHCNAYVQFVECPLVSDAHSTPKH